MHPFALNKAQTKKVAGGKLIPTPTRIFGENGEHIIRPPFYYTTMAYGEEGGELPLDPIF